MDTITMADQLRFYSLAGVLASGIALGMLINCVASSISRRTAKNSHFHGSITYGLVPRPRNSRRKQQNIYRRSKNTGKHETKDTICTYGSCRTDETNKP